jgi:hypothetical protein
MRRFFLVLLLLGASAIRSFCQQNEIAQGFTDTPAATAAINADIDHNSYSIFTISQARDLLLNTLCAANACDPDAKDFYAVIHILKWSDVQSNKQTVVGEHWYVYHPVGQGWTQDQFTDGKRLFGTKSFFILYVHLHLASTLSNIPVPVYQIQITKTIPQNVANLFALLQLETGAAARPPDYPDKWGGRVIVVGQRPSDIKIDPRAITDPSKPASSSEVTTAQTFHNEGKYWWDVSVAVPVKKISELKFDSTNNTVAPTQTSTQNMFAVLDIYLKPIDLSGTTYSLIPHPLVGVSMAKQPLHKILVGGAVGFHFVEVYAGALFAKQQSLTGLSTGSPATPPQVAAASKFGYETQFSVGINLPVRSIVNALKSTKKSGT